MKKTILIIILFFGIVKANYGFDVDLNKIAMIESSNNPLAESYLGAKGMYQIMPVVLLEFNQRNKTNFVSKNLFNAQINKNISDWYYNKRIPEYLKVFKIQDTIENRLIAYHDGIGNLRKYLRGERRLGKKMRDYIIKYKK